MAEAKDAKAQLDALQAAIMAKKAEIDELDAEYKALYVRTDAICQAAYLLREAGYDV